MKKIIKLTESDITRIVKRVISENESKSDLLDLTVFQLRKKLGLPSGCKIEIKKGDCSGKNLKYPKYVKYIITQLPSPVDDNREKIMKKIESLNTEKMDSHASPNFGKGITWIIKY
jgi:hypothetical protein